jgi:putative methionine-R-sulfoxide reductase with GAF domain
VDAVTRVLDRRDAMLQRLDEQLQQAANASEAAWVLCDYTGRELNLADCVVYLPAGDDTLVQAAAWGPRRGAERMLESPLQLAFGKGIVGSCARTLQAQRVDDTRLDPRYLADDQANLAELAVPIAHDDILLGILDSESPEQGFYDARYEAVFAAIAECGASRLWHLQARRAATR